MFKPFQASTVFAMGPRNLEDRKKTEFTENQYLLSQNLI